MSSVEKFRTPSPIHIVEIESGGFSIYPKSENKTDVENFQDLAKEALNEHFEGWEAKPNGDNMTINMVFFQKLT